MEERTRCTEHASTLIREIKFSNETHGRDLVLAGSILLSPALVGARYSFPVSAVVNSEDEPQRTTGSSPRRGERPTSGSFSLRVRETGSTSEISGNGKKRSETLSRVLLRLEICFLFRSSSIAEIFEIDRRLSTRDARGPEANILSKDRRTSKVSLPSGAGRRGSKRASKSSAGISSRPFEKRRENSRDESRARNLN